jgi:hypothetical protein|tara:strand:+ start:1331 stop:1783 length:453 start_codon:yes stop_codon:yes gene_type:complete
MNTAGRIYSLRLKLSDFINTEFESIVIDKINEANESHTFKLQLWYDEGEVTAKDLKSFIEKYESLLHYKTTIKPNRNVDRAVFTWYDVLHIDDVHENFPYRFQYRGKEDRLTCIITGIQAFKNCLSFVASDKPSKQERPKRKQKRNDYED